MSYRPFRRKLYKLAEDEVDKDIFKYYADRLEQVAADTYGHHTENGWCCACEADIAFAESWLRETKPEIFAAPTN